MTATWTAAAPLAEDSAEPATATLQLPLGADLAEWRDDKVARTLADAATLLGGDIEVPLDRPPSSEADEKEGG